MMHVISGWDYFYLFVAGLLGIVIHIFVKIRRIRKRYPDLGPTETFQIYFKKDWDSPMFSFVVVLACMFVINEFIFTKEFDETSTMKELGWKYNVVKLIRTLFIVIGYSAQSLIYSSLGKAEKFLEQKAKDAGVNVPQEEN